MSDVVNKPMVVLFIKGYREAIAHAALSVAAFAAMIGIGVLLDSSVMQSIGGIMWVIWVFGFSISMAKNHCMSIADARKRLDEIEMGWK